MEKVPNQKKTGYIRGKIVEIREATNRTLRHMIRTLDPMLPAQLRYLLAATLAFGGGMGNVVSTAREAVCSVKDGVINVGVSIKSGAKDVTNAATNVHKTIQGGASSVTNSFYDVASISANGVKSVGSNFGVVLKETKRAANSVLNPCVTCGNMPLVTNPPLPTGNVALAKFKLGQKQQQQQA
ncbi:hemolysin-like protein [Trichoplusia ni ascovirus 6b]|nr:hemolysin-like protein [Trichoplusia ni ascovirus 6b]